MTQLIVSNLDFSIDTKEMEKTHIFESGICLIQTNVDMDCYSYLLQKSNLQVLPAYSRPVITLRMALKLLLDVIDVEPFHLSQFFAKNVKHWQKMHRNHFLILSKQNKSVNSNLTNYWNGPIACHLIGSWSFISLFQLTDRYWPQKSWLCKADTCLLYASLQLCILALTQQGPVLLTIAVLKVQNVGLVVRPWSFDLFLLLTWVSCSCLLDHV